MNIRAAATRSLLEVVDNGRSLSDVLPDALKKFSDTRDSSLMQAICYGVCRWYFYLDAIVQLLLEKPLKTKDRDIHVLIMVGLYQLIFLRVPDHAAVGETVSATKALKKIWAKNLVNGVLRQYQRRADELQEKIKQNPMAVYSHPDWLIQKIKKDWPNDWQVILEANNQHPPLTLRVNQRKQNRDTYLASLNTENIGLDCRSDQRGPFANRAAQGCAARPQEQFRLQTGPAGQNDSQGQNIKAEILPETSSGIILENPVDVSALPGFQQGHVSVQDGAAQLAADLLMLKPGQRVLDACAAPGGKTTHILESEPELSEVLAIDCNAERLKSVQENCQRLQLHAKLMAADVGDLSQWWDGKLFDRILLDVPCSASGVIRRHPDIKLLRRPTDLAAFSEEQGRLLKTIWQTLKPGGILLYATCSIFHEENDVIVKSFLESQADAKEEQIIAQWGKDCAVGKQILPGMHKMDGFYYARLRKVDHAH